jgi:hypothetical protein
MEMNIGMIHVPAFMASFEVSDRSEGYAKQGHEAIVPARKLAAGPQGQVTSWLVH